MGNDSVYVIQPIPGKGKGVVATATILKGTRILFESPLFSITRSYKATKKRELQQQIARKVASLPRKQRRAFRSLYNAFEDEDPGDLGIVRTNALPLGHEATESGIFLDGARFNHSCSFNAHDNWNEILQKLTIHAVRDIEEGEEITICYLETIQNRGARQSGLQDIFGFLCLCSLCALPPFKSRESDKRWDEVEKLDNLIGSEEIYYHFPLRGLHSVHRLLNIFRVEGYAGGRIARAYYDAFSMAAAHGDRARARIFARRSASARLILEGDDSPIVKKLEVSAKDPKLHLAFGLTERWKTTVDDIPVGLDGVAFERWLWKREEVGQYADLRKESASFPSFAKLPSDKHIDLEFYASLDGMFHPRRHWCFLAEITDYDDFLQLRLSVKDKAGQEIPVAFQTDERGFDFSPQKNHTVAILYPEQNSFLDSSVGIRVENSAILNVSWPEKTKQIQTLILTAFRFLLSQCASY